jgi:hypothetical protein
LLGHPRRVGVPGSAQDVHSPGPDLDREQHLQRPEHERFDSEEVKRQDPLGLGPQELAPRGAATARSRAEAACPQERADLRGRHSDSEFRQLAPDPEASPPGVLPSDPQDELSNLIGDRWPPSDRDPFVSPLLPHQVSVPAKERLWAHHEGRPSSSRKGPAQHGHEQSVAAAKMCAAHLAPEDHQLVAKDHHLDVRCQIVGGASDQLDQPASTGTRTRRAQTEPPARMRPDATNALGEAAMAGFCALQASALPGASVPVRSRSCLTGSCARTASPTATPGCARRRRPARSSGSIRACAVSSFSTAASPRSKPPRPSSTPGSRTTTRTARHQALEMATPAERFRLAPLAKDDVSIPVDAAEDHAGQWVLRRVASNGYVSVDNQAFSVGNAFKTELVDVFVDQTTIQVWSKNHLINTVARERSGPVRKVRADGLHVKHQPDTERQASARILPGPPTIPQVGGLVKPLLGASPTRPGRPRPFPREFKVSRGRRLGPLASLRSVLPCLKVEPLRPSATDRRTTGTAAWRPSGPPSTHRFPAPTAIRGRFARRRMFGLGAA